MNLKKYKESPDYSKLTEDQKKFFTAFFSGKNLFITGAGGTGKSFCIKSLFSFIRSQGGISIGKTASTGVAAFNIEGSTIHSWSGIGLGDEDVKSLIQTAFRNKKARARVESCKVLIIDEISMISAGLLDKLDLVFKYIRFNNKPFGGIQVVFVGDFLQLPPVFRIIDEKSGFAFKSRAWKEADIEVVNLKQVMRQKDNTDFVKLLNEVRMGETKSLSLLKSRVDVLFPDDDIKPVKVFCKNIDVNSFNKDRLDKIQKPLRTFRAIDLGSEHFVKHLDKNCPAPTILELKEGAQVMLLKNLDVEGGLVNGSIGVVKSFTSDGACVKFCNGREALVVNDEWNIKEQVIGFDKTISYKVVATREQIPLKLAWASTVHKIQGATLDRVELDLDEAFASGQVYVALSRVRSLEGLSLKEFSPHKIIANQECLEFYKNL